MRLRRILLVFLAASFMLPANCRAAMNAASDKTAVDDSAAALLHHPLGGAEPVPVRLGLYVIDLAMVDEASENFEIQGYIYASWKDDRLIDKTALNLDKPRKLAPEAVWNPELDIENVRTFKSFRSEFFCFPDGTVYWEERFDAILSAEYFLRRFPFDRQALFVIVQPATSPARPRHSLVEFAPTDFATGLGPDTYLAAWDVESIRYSRPVGRTNSMGLDAPRAQFEIMVKRRSGFYVWKVFLPILLMTMVTWTTFWVKADEFDWQMKIPLTSLLAMIAFEFAISRDLPRVNYLTFLDAVFLNSFVFAFIAILEAIIVHILVMRGDLVTARQIHHNARWAVPAAFVVVLMLLVPMFFIGAGRPAAAPMQIGMVKPLQSRSKIIARPARSRNSRTVNRLICVCVREPCT